MSKLRVSISIGAVCLALAVAVTLPARPHHALAATPGPSTTTATSQVATTPGTSTPTPLAVTPGGVPAPFEVFGQAWVDARPSSAVIRAVVAGKVCGSAEQLLSDAGLSFDVKVASAAQQPGCGTTGAIVQFMIGDRIASQTLQWQSGVIQHVTLISGPPFAEFTGSFTYYPKLAGLEVEPVIGGATCGVPVAPLLGAGPTYTFDVVVDPQALHAGCGHPGAVVTFRLSQLVGAQRLRVADAIGTGVWQPGTTRLNLDFPATSLTGLPSAGYLAGSQDAVIFTSPLAIAALITLVLTGASLFAIGITRRLDW